jgi:REP element-mobilizing transposase RayT
MQKTPGKFDPKIHHRKSVRLRGYDYSQAGAYFVTIVTHRRDCLFGEILGEEMVFNDFGRIADECWRAIPEHFPNVELGAHVVMPNHVHGIVVIMDNGAGRGTDDGRGAGDGGRGAALLRPYSENPHKINVKPGSLGAIVRSFKSAVSYRINKQYNATGIWQRNYHEHIIRNEPEMDKIWRYIEANPAQWNADTENPAMINQERQ